MFHVYVIDCPSFNEAFPQHCYKNADSNPPFFVMSVVVGLLRIIKRSLHLKVCYKLDFVNELYKLNIHNVGFAKHEKQDIWNCFEKRFEVFLAPFSENLGKT